MQRIATLDKVRECDEDTQSTLQQEQHYDCQQKQISMINVQRCGQNNKQLQDKDTESTTHPINDLYDNDKTQDDMNAFISKIFTVKLGPLLSLDEIYTINHWNHRMERITTVDQDLLRYTPPLGMGFNDPMPPEENPLFVGDEPQYTNTTDSTFPVVAVT